MSKKQALVFAGLLALLLGVRYVNPPGPGPDTSPTPVVPSPGPLRQPATPRITDPFPPHLSYSGVTQKLVEWEKEAPELCKAGSYGRTSKGQIISFLRVTNLLNEGTSIKKKCLVTACIHGNEPLSTSTTMSVIGSLLSTYGKDVEVTSLLDTRDIYFVPVVSPDSYPSARHVDGVDPNRDFPGPSRPSHVSTPSIKSIQDFFLLHKFQCAISGHTFGRVYLYNYGDDTKLCPDDAHYVSVLSKMQALSKYRKQRACEMYGSPIYGSEADWYYRNGAISIVCEYGTHQNIPTLEDTKRELDMTYRATLLFLREAPLLVTERTSRSGLLATLLDERLCSPWK